MKIAELAGRGNPRRGRRPTARRRKRGSRDPRPTEVLAADLAIRFALLEADVDTAARWLSGRAPRDRAVSAAEVSAWLDVLTTELLALLGQVSWVEAAQVTAVVHRLTMLRNIHRDVEASPSLLRLDLREQGTRSAHVVRTLWGIADGLSRLLSVIDGSRALLLPQPTRTRA